MVFRQASSCNAGDIIVYDLAAKPMRVVRAVANTSKAVDPIDHIGWSLDDSRLVSTHRRSVRTAFRHNISHSVTTKDINIYLVIVTVQGVLRVWACQSAGAQARQDLHSIGLENDSAGVSPETLRNIVELDIERGDTKFQAGAPTCFCTLNHSLCCYCF